MIESDKSAFTAVMMGAGEVYGREVSKDLLRLYFSTMANLTIEQVQGAMIRHMQDPQAGQYWPKPADLIRQIIGTSAEQQRSLEDKAGIAWSCIEDQIRRKGAYGSLRLDDRQALAAVQAMGGWKHLCAQTTDQLVWCRKEFIRMYESFERTPLEALPESLPGIFELAQHKQQARGQLQSLAGMVASWAQQNQPAKQISGGGNA